MVEFIFMSFGVPKTFQIKMVFCIMSHRFQTGSGPYLISYPMGTGSYFHRGKAGHSPPSSAEDKNACGYISTLPYFFMAWYLVKHRIFMVWCLVKHSDSFTFTYM
jgi:hypothetical protein